MRDSVFVVLESVLANATDGFESLVDIMAEDFLGYKILPLMGFVVMWCKRKCYHVSVLNAS